MRWVACITFEFLLAFRTSVDYLCQEGFKIVDVKINMNWCPVSLISTNIVSSPWPVWFQLTSRSIRFGSFHI
jgi:hypothetical protein